MSKNKDKEIETIVKWTNRNYKRAVIKEAKDNAQRGRKPNRKGT